MQFGDCTTGPAIGDDCDDDCEGKSYDVDEAGSYDKYIADDAPCWSAASQALETQQERSAMREALPHIQAMSMPLQPWKLPVTHDC